MAEPLEYPVSIPGIDEVLDKFREWSTLTLTLDEAMAKLDGRNLSIGKLTKAVEGQAAAQGKAKKATVDQSEAIELMASRAEMSATTLESAGRSQELLIKIGGQYAEILRETGTAQSELMKAWQAGLSPAENSARKLVQLTAKTEEATLKTTAARVAVGELSDRLEDQVRRQDENTRGNNKLSRSLTYLIHEQTDALQTTQVLTTAYSMQRKQLDAVETAMSALNIPGADLAERAKHMADAFETATESMTPAQTSMLKVGLAVGTVGAAAGALVLGIGALGAAIVGIVSQADEWNDELVRVGEGLDETSAKSIYLANDALGGVKLGMESVGVAIASTFAPMVRDAGVRLTAMGLAAVDGWNNIAGGGPILEQMTRLVAEGFVGALTMIPKAMLSVGDATVQLAQALHLPFSDALADAVSGMVEDLNSFEADQVDGVAAALKMLGNDAIKPLIAASDDYMVRAESMIGAIGRQRMAAKALADTQKAEAIPAMRETALAIGEATAAFAPFTGAVQELTSYEFTSFSDELKQSAASAEAIQDNLKSAASAISDTAGNAYSMVNSISRAVTGLDLAALFRAQGPDAGKALVDGLMTALEDAPALVGGIAEALIGGVKELAADAGALADLSVGVVEAIAEALPELAKEMPALASALIEALVPEIPTLVAEIVKMSPEIGAAIGFGLAEVILEALGLDKQAAQLDEVYRVGGAEFKARTQAPDKPLAQQGPTSSDRALMLTLDDMQRALVKHGQVLDSFRDSITYLFQSLTLKGALTRK